MLDGGLATELEARGHRLDDALWSARLLQTHPQDIEQVHLDFLSAGADVISSASYQATIEGFVRSGLEPNRARELIRMSVELCHRARARFELTNKASRQFDHDTIETIGAENWFDPRGHLVRKRVAASVGPYGAYLANGAEYTGDYDLDESALVRFHAERWHLLASGQPDLMLCETVPSFREARALARVARLTPSLPTWISFSCRDEGHLSDGTPIQSCGQLVEDSVALRGIGINCTPPRFISELVEKIRAVTNKPILVYPNSGERYDASAKNWIGVRDPVEFAALAREWQQRGAAVIGGCCRTGMEHIRALAKTIW